jgi:hypothetical protein
VTVSVSHIMEGWIVASRTLSAARMSSIIPYMRSGQKKLRWCHRLSKQLLVICPSCYDNIALILSSVVLP